VDSRFRVQARVEQRAKRRKSLVRSNSTANIQVSNCLFPILHFALIIVASLCYIPNTFGQAVDPGDEKIHHGDLIEVDELGGFDYDWRGRLNPEGFLDGFAKIVNPVNGLCKTPAQLADAIREIYAKSLRDPKVIVRILDRSQRPEAILDGAIRQPMRLQIRRTVRLSELAVISGGFTDRGSGEITVLRPPNQSCDSTASTTTVTKVRISEILSGDQAANISIRSGDIVTVESVEPIYVIGGVNRPGKVDWREGSTLSRVVAAAGGVSDRGVSGTVSIFRRQASGSVVIDVDLDRVVRGTDKDVEIRPFDIIDVPIRGEPKRSSPPVADTGETRVRQQPLPLRVIN
jgi:protein involved in polysaccharide export with SLBB domain